MAFGESFLKWSLLGSLVALGGCSEKLPSDLNVPGAFPPPPGQSGGAEVPEYSGDTVKVSGILILPETTPAGPIQIDVNGSVGHLASATILKPGEFTIPTPESAGEVYLKFFVGGAVDPEERSYFDWGPVQVGEEDITGLKVDLSAEAPSRIADDIPPVGPPASDDPTEGLAPTGDAPPSGEAPPEQAPPAGEGPGHDVFEPPKLPDAEGDVGEPPIANPALAKPPTEGGDVKGDPQPEGADAVPSSADSAPVPEGSAPVPGVIDPAAPNPEPAPSAPSESAPE